MNLIQATNGHCFTEEGKENEGGEQHRRWIRWQVGSGVVVSSGVLRPVLKSLTNPSSGKELQVASGPGELGDDDGLDSGLARDRKSTRLNSSHT